MQSDGYRKDEHRSLRNRAEAVLGKAMKNEDELRKNISINY